MNNCFKTIKAPAEGLYKEKGSKFIGYAFPVKNEDEVRERISHLRKEHPKARHVCYAFVLGEEKENYKANDDGEPSGTAGKPILNQILAHDVTNVLIAVVRYFGGTLLGASGLVRAYKVAAIEALEHAVIKPVSIVKAYELVFNYDQLGDIRKVVEMERLQILKEDFEAKCCFLVGVTSDCAQEVINKFELLEQVTIKDKGKYYI